MLLTVRGLDAGGGDGPAGAGADRLRRARRRDAVRASATPRPGRARRAAEARLDPLRGRVVPVAVGLAGAALALWFLLPQVATQVRRARRAAGHALRRADGRGDQRHRHRRRAAAAVHRHAGDDGDGARGGAADRGAEQRRAAGLHRLERGRRVRRAAEPRLRDRAGAGPVLPRRRADLRRGAALHHLRPLRLRDRRQRGGGAALGHRRRADQDRDLRDLGDARRGRGGALRGAVPPGQARRRRRARARRDRGGGDRRHQPDGRARADGGHARRRADLRAAVEPAAAPQHQLEPSAGAEGADHRRGRAHPGAQPRRDHGEPAPAGPRAARSEPAAAARPEGETGSRELGGSA